MVKRFFLGLLKIVSLTVLVVVGTFLIACTIKYFKRPVVTTLNEELANEETKSAKKKAPAETKEKAPAETKEKAPAEAKPTTISLLCKWDSCEEVSQIKEFHERTAYSSIEDARKDPIIWETTNVRPTFMLPPELKNVKIHYEQFGKFKKVKFDKKNRVATIDRLATDYTPRQTIVHIQCSLGSFFLYTDTEKRPFNPGSGAYVAGIGMDEHDTVMHFNPIQFGDSLTKFELRVEHAAVWGTNLIFYFDTQIEVTVFDEQNNKFIKTHKKNIGNFYIFSVENVAHDGIEGAESYIITLTIKGQKSQCLRVKTIN